MNITNIKELIRYTANSNNRKAIFGGFIGSDVLSLNDEYSDKDIIVYVEPTKKELYLHQNYTKTIEVKENITITLKSITGIFKEVEKASFNLLEVLNSLIYIKKSKRNREIVDILMDWSKRKEVDDTLRKNMFFIGSHEMKKNPNEKFGSKAQFQKGDINLKSTSKAYLYKKQIELKRNPLGYVDVETREVYQKIRKDEFENLDALLEELTEFYNNEDVKNRMISYSISKELKNETISKLIEIL